MPNRCLPHRVKDNMPILPPLYSRRKPKETRHDPFYDLRRWRRLTVSHRQAEPLCRQCREKGVTTAGTVVDHIIPRLEGGAEWDEDNLQTLCDKCHQVKRQTEKGRKAL